MRIPELVWDRRHNVAWLQVSFGSRAWDRVEVGDLVLGYNATGRLYRVVLRDPRRMLPSAAGPAEAVAATIDHLSRSTAARQPDLEVLRSAYGRAREMPRAAAWPMRRSTT